MLFRLILKRSAGWWGHHPFLLFTLLEFPKNSLNTITGREYEETERYPLERTHCLWRYMYPMLIGYAQVST